MINGATPSSLYCVSNVFKFSYLHLSFLIFVLFFLVSLFMQEYGEKRVQMETEYEKEMLF